MLAFLKNHPFAVEAHFDRSLVLTFALPKSQLARLIPEPLQLDTFQDEWAFLAIAMVQTRSLRPKGFPQFMGNDFFLAGYRVFVRYHTLAGKRLRGLYILKSETDKKKMQWLGNTFTHYNYTTTDIETSLASGTETIQSGKSDFHIQLGPSEHDPELPGASPFDSWKEARRFAGPLPFTFTCDPVKKTVLIIEGVRSHWKPTPIQVRDFHFKFLEQRGLQEAILASAFEVRNIPYHWKKGKLESWK